MQLSQSLKYFAVIIFCCTIVYSIVQLQTCNAQNLTSGTMATPVDSNYLPVTTQSFQPSSLPFVKKNSGFRLPANVKEKNVKRVVSLNLKPSFQNKKKTVDIIETKDGGVYVRKDSAVESVTITEFEPPMARTVLLFGVGVTTGIDDNRATFKPAAVFAPLEWYGWIHVPVLIVDLEGVGAGMQFKLYHDVYAGAGYYYTYNYREQAKLHLAFMF